jgi:hypothetical protein
VPLYDLALRTTVTTTGAAAMELRAGARRVRVLEVGISLAAATASTYGLGRPASAGTATSPVLAQAQDPADIAALASGAVTWSAAPTAPTVFLRRLGTAATIGSGVVWTFSRLVIPVNGSLVLWNLAANSAATEVYWSVEE